ncbi:MAG: hypothetical protein MGAcid_10240 [uncultured Acidilobus sp. MG]|nr:MAG: hypothetical protein MGAcid_10240 [uncultured Acidilobus sp. MG]
MFRRGAVQDGSYVDVADPEAVVPADADGLIGQAGLVEGPEEVVAGLVACEHPPRPVASVGGWGHAYNNYWGQGVAEARNRP